MEYTLANKGFSVADDLMVGAGTLFFNRYDSNGNLTGFHHMGNCDEFNITVDITKIEKNSSMNKRRELMKSIVTEVKPSGTLTMTEYDPTNLALGLFGTEGVQSQSAVTLINEKYDVDVVPGLIRLVDADGNPYYNATDVTIKRKIPIPAEVKFSGETPYKYTDIANGTIELVDEGSAYKGVDEDRMLLTIDTAPTAAGDLDGMVVTLNHSNPAYTVETHTFTTGTSYAWTTSNGTELKFTVTTSDTFTASATAISMKAKPGTDEYTPDEDYIVDEHLIRGGIIQIPSGSSIKAGDTVLISAKIPAEEFPTISMASAGEIEGQLLYIGDPNCGGRYNIEGWDVKVTPSGDLTGLIGTEFGSFKLTVDFLADYEHHPSYPYAKATLVGVA